MWDVGVNTQIWVAGFGAEDVGLISKAASMGFDEIEMSFGPTAERPFPTADVRAALGETGLRSTLCGALTADMDITSGDEVHATAALTFFEHALSTAAEIGAEVFCGPLYAPLFRRRMLSFEARARERRNAARVLARVGALAEQAGVHVALEPINRYETDLINVVDDALKVVEEAGSAFVGLHLDTFHMNLEEQDSASAITRAGRHLRHVHISESDRGVPGTGQVHWAEVRAALADIDYAGLIVVEGFNPGVPELANNANIWREFAADADDYARSSLAFMRDFAKAAAN